MKKTAVITGAGGFIGRKLAVTLRERGFRVRGVDLFDPAEGYPGCDESIPADITRPIGENMPLLKACKDAELVCHLAAKVHALSEVQADDAQYERINTMGTLNVLEAAKAGGVRTFLLFSTIKVFGEKTVSNATRPITEDDPTDPDTPYGDSKRKAEQLVLSQTAIEQRLVLRLAMVYGAGAKGNMVPLIRAIRRGLPVWLPEFHNKRSMVDVDDVVAAAVQLVQTPTAQGIYTVTDGETYSIGRILHEIRMALGRKDPWLTIPAWCFQAMAKIGDGIGRLRGKRFLFDSDKLNKLAGNAWFSSERLVKELGFVPTHKFADSLPGMIAQVSEDCKNRENEKQRRNSDEGTDWESTGGKPV